MRSEFALLEALRPRLSGDTPHVPLGVGDDAAVVHVAGADVVVAVDALVEGVHFDLAISSHADVGWKALAANVSDLAAVGARTRAALVVLQRPAGFDDAAAEDLYRGLDQAASRWDVALVGGDLVSGPGLAVSVTVLGELVGARPLRRADAIPGQAVVVIGPLGQAAAGLALARAGRHDLLDRHPHLLARHRRPDALAEAGAVLVQVGAGACIDVSDGLGRDAGHVARASGVGLRLRSERLPVDPGVAAAAEALGSDPFDLVCGGGDDLALLATLDPDRLAALDDRLAGLSVAWRQVGTVDEGDGVRLVLPDGRERDVGALGWEHAGDEETDRDR